MKIKSCVLGDRASGKTTLLSHIDNRLKTAKYVPTLGVDFVVYNKSGLCLHIWDTSGSNRFATIVRTFLRDVSLILIVYNSRRSLEKVDMYIEWVEGLCNRDYRVILVSLGTDVELECDGQFKASEHNIPHFTCNALNRSDSLVFWHDLMYYCTVEIKGKSWILPDMKIEKKEIRRNSYRLCWWL